MRKSRPRERRLPGRGTAATAGAAALTLAGAGAALAAELRHRQAVSGDPQWRLLSSPLEGREVAVSSADGTEIHAEVFGPSGAPTVVLIPGWTEELRVFDLLTRGLLGRGFRVVAYDLRGQGRSDSRPGLDQRIERYAEDLDAVLTATCGGGARSLGDDVILAGHSMGGMAVVAWAGRRETGVRTSGADGVRVRAVALVSTGVSELVDDLGVLPGALPPAARRAILTPLLASSAPLIPFSTPVSRVVNRHLMFGPQGTAAHLALVEPMVWRMNGRLRAGAARTMRELDLTGALARIDVPALVVVGDGDRLTPAVHARRLVAALPQVAEFLVLPRTGHMVQLERPEELADALRRLALRAGIEPAPEPRAQPEPGIEPAPEPRAQPEDGQAPPEDHRA